MRVVNVVVVVGIVAMVVVIIMVVIVMIVVMIVMVAMAVKRIRNRTGAIVFFVDFRKGVHRHQNYETKDCVHLGCILAVMLNHKTLVLVSHTITGTNLKKGIALVKVRNLTVKTTYYRYIF